MSKKLINRLVAFVLVTMMIMSTLVVPSFAAVTLSKELTLYMVPNTHLDTAWQHPFPQVANNTSYGIRPMFRNATTYLRQNPEYRFTTSASAHFKMLKDYYNEDNPVTADRLWKYTQELVEKGQLDIAGGQIVEPDLNIPGGEALVRQSLYGQHFFMENFKDKDGNPYVAKTGMVPDVFGFSGQMPQFLYKSEMEYFVTSKVNWNDTTAIGSTYENFRTGNRNRDADIMYWQALDGESKILANFLQNDYNNTSVSNIQAIFNANWNDGESFHGGSRNTGVRNAMAFYGGGDFGQGMTNANTGNDGNSYRFHEYVAANQGAQINVKSSTVTQFFEETVDTEDLNKLSYIDGEMYAEFHRGTYTTWARLKKYNRDNEILGESAEKAATIGFYTNSISTNSQDRLEDGWYKVLINQMHDVLPGSCLAYQYYITFNQEELAKNLFNGVRDNALAALAYRADTNVKGKPIFVYNDLSWPRDGEVTVRLQYDNATLPSGNVVVYDENNNPIYPSNIIRDEVKNWLTVTFMATDVPAIGYKVFDARVEEPGSRVTSLKVDASNWAFENDYIKMKLNPQTGYISSLQTKVDGAWREMFAQGVGTEGAELHVYKDCDEVRPMQNFDVWDLNRAEMDKEPDFIFDGAPKSMEIICNTPEKVIVRVVKEWGGSQVAQDISMYADSDRVDVHLAADWYQTKRLLKVSFPIDADTDYATYETSFGAVQRPTNRDNPFGYARYEVPVHKWSDVTDESGDYGVSILNDAKYGNDTLRKVLSNGKVFVRNRITVARTPRAQAWAPSSGTYASPAAPYVVDSGRHEFNYSIYPHSGSWEDSQTVNKGYELNYPMTAFEAVKSLSNGFGSSKSFASSDKSNVIISALKNQYDDPTDNNTVVVRVYESSGRDTDGVTITLPANIVPGSAKEVNMLEHDYDRSKALTVNGNTIKFNIGKYEILTIQAELVPSTLSALTVPQESVTLAFNTRGVSSNSSRYLGNTSESFYLDGSGNSGNAGLSMPQEHWPENNKINYQGIEFNLGAPDANNFIYGTETNRTINVTTANKYSKIYIVGAASGTGPVDGGFTVNYADGNPTDKSITFNGWRSDLSGWNRLKWTDDKAYVLDSVAHFNGHYHSSTGSSNTSEVYEYDNYLFVYDIDIDNTRTVSSIQIPDNSNIKIAAITLANPVDGFGKVYDSTKEYPWSIDAPTPSKVQNVKAVYDAASTPAYSNFIVTWDMAENAVKYKIYSGGTPDFTPSTSNQVAETGTLSYTHVGPTLTGDQVLAGTTQLYYKVIAVGRATNDGEASDASNGIAPQFVDYALGLTSNSRVRANAQNTGETAANAVNGSLTGKWCTAQGGTSGAISASNPAWLAVDLTGIDGQTVQIDRFEVYHCGAGGEQASANTRAFNIKGSTNSTNALTTSATSPNGDWTTIVNVTNNPNNSSGNVTIHPVDIRTRFVRLYITDPEGTRWSGATRIYGFKAIGMNPDFVEPAPLSIATDAEIVQTPILVADKTFGLVNLAVDYDFYNQDGSITEDISKTEYKWYRKLQDNYREYYVVIPGSFKDFTLTPDEARGAVAYKCDITVYDSEGNKGQTVSVETGAYVNVLKGATLVDYSSHGSNNTAPRLVDGINGGSNKWDVNTVTYPSPHWATFDMGSVQDIDVIKVYHANSYAASGSYDADAALNTYDFDVSYSTDGENWITKEIRANMNPTTTINLGGTVKARFIKIYVITSNAYVVGQGSNSSESNYLSIRIGEIEALASIVTGNSPAKLYEGGDKLSLAEARGNTVDVVSRFYTDPMLDGSINVYAAAYNDGGNLLSVGQGYASFDEEGIFDSTIEDFEVPEDTAKIKVFYWSDDGAMIPISEAALAK